MTTHRIILILSALITISAHSHSIKPQRCSLEDFKLMVSSSKLDALSCANLDELIHEDIGYGRRALHVAILNRKSEHAGTFLKLLLQRKINISNKDVNGRTALDYLLTNYSDNDEETLASLIEKTDNLDILLQGITHSRYIVYSADNESNYRVKFKLLRNIWTLASLKIDLFKSAADKLTLSQAIFEAFIGSEKTLIGLEKIIIDDYLLLFNEIYPELNRDSKYPSTLLSKIFSTVALIEKKSTVKLNFTTHLIHHYEVDESYPSSGTQLAQSEYMDRVKSIIVSDNEIDLDFLFRHRNVSINNGLVDLLQFSIVNRSKKCLNYLLNLASDEYFYASIKNSHFTYVHDAILANDMDIFSSTMIRLKKNQTLYSAIKTYRMNDLTAIDYLNFFLDRGSHSLITGTNWQDRKKIYEYLVKEGFIKNKT